MSSGSYKIDMPSTPSTMARANSFSSSTTLAQSSGMAFWKKALLTIIIIIMSMLSIYALQIIYFGGPRNGFSDGGNFDKRPYKPQEDDRDNVLNVGMIGYDLAKPKTSYDITLVADRDTFSYQSKEKVWTSMLIHGKLIRNAEPDADGNIYRVQWKNLHEPQELKSKLVEGDRGMELSELKRWRNKLYTICDRTGIVYEVTDDGKVIARYILMDGNGATQKGFKGEWMTVKNDKLIIGSIGKEWSTKSGEVINYNPMFIKSIDRFGHIEHLNWKHVYDGIREKLQVPYPGYIIHEAMEWSEIHHKWFILPRRVSKESYNDEVDIMRGSNILIIASEDFSDMQVKTVGTLTPTRGFSTFKILPDRPHEIIAVKSEETMDGKMNSYLTVFSINGDVLMKETRITGDKMEGIEVM